MAANTEPIFPAVPNVSWGSISAANTAKDGTGTVVTLFTAGANGARLDSIKIQALGTNVATVLRFFINNGSSNATAANNVLLHETTLLAATVTETAANNSTTILFDGSKLPQVVLKAGHKINMTLGTAVAAGYAVCAIGGDY